MASNCIVIDTRRVELPPSVVAAGGVARNYLDDGEPRLTNDIREQPLTTFVLHETSGNSASGCKATLKKKRLGVHLILDKDGTLTCHADLARDVCWHAGQANGISVGIEVVNAYRPEASRPPQGETIPAQWWTWVPKGRPREYVCPTDVQMAVLKPLVPWLCGLLSIPYVFPTAALDAKKPQIAGWRLPPLGWRAKPPAGVVAHRDFSAHADGRYLLEAVINAAFAP